MQLTGKAIIRVDGQEWRCEDGASLDVGGVKREAKAGGGKVHGYTEETVPPELECKAYHTKDTDVTAINKIIDATVLFETDTGDRYCATPLCWSPASWKPRTALLPSNSAA